MTVRAELNSLRTRYEAYKSRGLALDMTRGKPGPEQLDLALPMLSLVNENHFKSPGGVDCRNYGVLDGLPEVKALFADFLGVAQNEVLIGGSASLSLMYDAVVRLMLNGAPGGDPWAGRKVRFLCPAPGYDRHFNICQDLGIEMITVPLNEDGPDMDTVARLAAEDASIVGIWCVPQYGNPTGCVYSDEVVDRLATMPTAAADFRIFWDNAYAVHHLVDNPTIAKNILDACKAAGNPDRVLLFGSTSKISFAGAGVSAMGASEANINWMLKHMGMQIIGHDKLNQLRHLEFFKNMDGVREHMKKHAAILKPKFDAVLEILERELGGKDLATWSKPEGGYFISLDTRAGLAAKVVGMAGDAGVKLTGAGATFPYKKDPNDSNIRLAPSLPSLDEITTAMEVVAVCIQIASLEQELN